MPGGMMPPAAPRSLMTGRRLLVVLALGMFLLRANWGSLRPIVVASLQRLAAACGLTVETKSDKKKRRKSGGKNSKKGEPLTPEEEEAAMQVSIRSINLHNDEQSPVRRPDCADGLCDAG